MIIKLDLEKFMTQLSGFLLQAFYNFFFNFMFEWIQIFYEFDFYSVLSNSTKWG